MDDKAQHECFCLFGFLTIYFVFEACFVSYISLGAGLDDAELISNLSFWNWGYGGSQPPLYTWIAYGLTKLFRLHFALLQFLRFTILASGFFAVYLGLRQLRVAPRLAAFACLSVFLLPQIAWESQRALIHSVLGTAGSAWSFAAFIWFVHKPNYARAVALGLAFMFAVLGKYNGLIFITALFLSAFFLSSVRRALLTRYFITAVIAALLFMMPALLFMLRYPGSVMERAVKFQVGSGPAVADRLYGLLDLLRASFSFVLPALILALILAFIVRWRQKRTEDHSAAEILSDVKAQAAADNAAARHFIGVILLCAIGFCVLMVVLSGATSIKDRWLQPVLFLVPPYLVLWLAQQDISGRAPRVMGILGVIAACFVPPMLYFNLYERAASAKQPIQNLDYLTLYKDLRGNGKITTILAPDPFFVGNLRLLNPQIKTLFAETPFAGERLRRPLVLLWKDQAEFPPKLRPILLKAGIKAPNLPSPHEADIPYRLPKDKKGRAERFYYIYLP